MFGYLKFQNDKKENRFEEAAYPFPKIGGEGKRFYKVQKCNLPRVNFSYGIQGSSWVCGSFEDRGLLEKNGMVEKLQGSNEVNLVANSFILFEFYVGSKVQA